MYHTYHVARPLDAVHKYMIKLQDMCMYHLEAGLQLFIK